MLEGNCEIIGLRSVIGPYSGIIKVSDGKNEDYKLNTWDRWCHFTREAFLLNHIVEGQLCLDIVDDAFDTSTCKEEVNFSGIKKNLVVRRIYYIGNNLHVVNMDEGDQI